jgi:hypothetical protein
VSSGFFQWSTPAGNIVSANTDSTMVNISAPGKYILQVSQKEGCPIKGVDTITVAADTSKPIATAGIRSTATGYPQLLGGDTTASNYATAFGGSKGLLWNWTGPNNFNSTAQNPLTNNEIGTYNLTVTERRNGCSVSSSVYVNFAMLQMHTIDVKGSWSANTVTLNWKNAGKDIDHYEVEKSIAGNRFDKIGSVNAEGNSTTVLVFKDMQPISGASYRIKAVTATGNNYYSQLVKPVNNISDKKLYSYNQLNGRFYLLANSDQQVTGKVYIYSLAGKMLKSQTVNILKGINTIELSGSEIKPNQVLIISFFVDNRFVMSEKVYY